MHHFHNFDAKTKHFLTKVKHKIHRITNQPQFGDRITGGDRCQVLGIRF
jgi:hypothetical protein